MHITPKAEKTIEVLRSCYYPHEQFFDDSNWNTIYCYTYNKDMGISTFIYL